jgi:hypothetical protein
VVAVRVLWYTVEWVNRRQRGHRQRSVCVDTGSTWVHACCLGSTPRKVKC